MLPVFLNVREAVVFKRTDGLDCASILPLNTFCQRVPLVYPLLVWVLFTSAVFAQANDGKEGEDSGNAPVVKGIQFEGLERFSPDKLLSRMETEVGEPFKEHILRNDIHRLYKFGSVNRVQWQKEDVEGGVRLVLIVQENPVIQKVKLVGVNEFTKNTLRDELEITSSRTMDPNKLNRDRKHLLKKYREKGFHFVEVRTRKLEGDSGMILRIEVVEGPQVYFGEITVKGTEAFEQDTVVDQMKSAPSWFWGSSYYREDRLRKDLDRIKAFYRGRGYLDVTVELQQVRFSASKEYAFVTIGVEEGAQYGIEQIQFEGNTVFEREALLQETVLRPGDTFRLNDVSADQQSLKLLYGENSYIDTRVNWSYQILEDSMAVRLVYQITERGKTRTGKIEISGNTKTREKVIRRQLEVEPGEPLNLVELRNSIQDLRATRYFKQVSIDRTETDEPGVKDLEVKVEETSTGRIRFGGGFSSNVGLIGIFQISQQNFDITNWPESFSEVLEGTAFAGGGQTLSITLKPGTERSRYSLSFREPYLYDQPIGLDVEGSLFSQIFDEYDVRQAGGSVGLDYRFEEEDLTISGDLERKNLDITDIDDDSPDDLLNIRGKHGLLSFTPGFSADKRNQSINTTSGYTFSSSYKYTTGDFDYGKWQNNFKKFFPLYTHPDTGNHVLTFQARYGIAHSFDDEKTPVFDRFYAGGTNTIRGFDFRTISPREGDDVEVGGENRWIANLEYTFPLIRSGRGPGGRRRDFLRGALFSDAGTVGFETRDLDDNIRASVGFGIRFKIPGMGQRPFALDFGFPIREVEGDETRVISFDIGASF